MFDIGFLELLVIAVVALLIFGPEEFPVMVRNFLNGLTKVRRFVNNVRMDLEHEVHKVEEVKQLMAREVEIAKEHAAIDPEKLTVPARVSIAPTATKTNDDNNATTGTQTLQETPTNTVGTDHGRNV